MSIAGNRPDVRITQSNDIGKLITAVNSIEINGMANFVNGVKVA